MICEYSSEWGQWEKLICHLRPVRSLLLSVASSVSVDLHR
jgi:hypothetical protein